VATKQKKPLSLLYKKKRKKTSLGLSIKNRFWTFLKCPIWKSAAQTANVFFQKSDFAWRCSQNRKKCEKFVTIKKSTKKIFFISVFFGVFFVP